MITTLCISCNAPAPEFDAYQELAAELLTEIAGGVTLLRVNNMNVAQKKKELPRGITEWTRRSTDALHRGNDLREWLTSEGAKSRHRDCDAWKITYRRVTALCVELDFMRTLVRGIS